MTEPQITDDEADQVAENFAEPAVSAPIKVKAGAAGIVHDHPEMIAEAITFAAADGTLVPELDADEAAQQRRRRRSRRSS